MDEKQVRDAVQKLATHFNVPAPTVSWRANTTRGRYYAREPKRGVFNRVWISLGPNTWRGVEASMIHEFAHYLQHARGGFEVDKCQGHGPAFHRALTDVAQFYYGDAAKYDWSTEYASLKAAGPRKTLAIGN